MLVTSTRAVESRPAVNWPRPWQSRGNSVDSSRADSTLAWVALEYLFNDVHSSRCDHVWRKQEEGRREEIICIFFKDNVFSFLLSALGQDRQRDSERRGLLREALL